MAAEERLEEEEGTRWADEGGIDRTSFSLFCEDGGRNTVTIFHSKNRKNAMPTQIGVLRGRGVTCTQ